MRVARRDGPGMVVPPTLGHNGQRSMPSFDRRSAALVVVATSTLAANALILAVFGRSYPPPGGVPTGVDRIVAPVAVARTPGISPMLLGSPIPGTSLPGSDPTGGVGGVEAAAGGAVVGESGPTTGDPGNQSGGGGTPGPTADTGTTTPSPGGPSPTPFTDPTGIPSPTPTSAAPAPTATATATATPTPTATATATPRPTSTPTPTPTPAPTPTPTPAPTPTPTPSSSLLPCLPLICGD